MQLVLQLSVRVKGSQRPLKDLLSTYQKQDLCLEIVYFSNTEHLSMFYIRIGILKVTYQKIQKVN